LTISHKQLDKQPTIRHVVVERFSSCDREVKLLFIIVKLLSNCYFQNDHHDLRSCSKSWSQVKVHGHRWKLLLKWSVRPRVRFTTFIAH